ncbi:acyl-ACP thioesterase domain-containing protein [Algoriphagus sp. CAU 1675]|uniref:acyl-[acyl-carrier-protein] thioesterase n=1 Tax=Algoriphagus sp. CAU 1675 TaxID=3032597 RepID=UPI0023DB0B0C|nr:acyl-ACP thioesterase domain-containing protein [Algoriphagus sp. CAU 1675]MDF2157345.1 thioesterase [Algoriphagus sp. CAU 1675]
MSLPENFQYHKKFQIGSFQVDPSGKLRIRSLADILQEIAWEHADSGDFGRKLLENNQMWVLSRFEFRIQKMPLWGKHVEVYTGGRGVDKLFAFREFLVQDEDGNELARAMSSWLLVHTQTKRILRPEQVLPEELFDPTLKPRWQPEKINLEGVLIAQDSIKVRYSDLDLYNHVNNTSYIRWIEDMLGELGLDINYLNINYLGECMLGDEVNLSLFEATNHFYFKGEVGGKTMITAIISK